MIQFYFLSIVLNALAGYILFSGDETGALKFRGDFSDGFTLKGETFRFVVGILSVIVGLLKLLSPVEGDVPVAGDLVPAITGFLSGFALIFEYYRGRASLDSSEHSEKIDKLLVSNKKIIGMASIAAAVLHFVFPRVLLL